MVPRSCGGGAVGGMVNESPQGMGVGAALALGLGMGARRTANNRTAAAVKGIDEATRSRAPLAAAPPNMPALTYQPGASRTGAPTKTAALAKLLAQMQSEEAATEAEFIRKGGI